MIEGARPPKPSDSEISRVQDWHEWQEFKRVHDELEELARVSAGSTWRGIPVDDRFSKEALIGIIVMMDKHHNSFPSGIYLRSSRDVESAVGKKIESK